MWVSPISRDFDCGGVFEEVVIFYENSNNILKRHIRDFLLLAYVIWSSIGKRFNFGKL